MNLSKGPTLNLIIWYADADTLYKTVRLHRRTAAPHLHWANI